MRFFPRCLDGCPILFKGVLSSVGMGFLLGCAPVMDEGSAVPAPATAPVTAPSPQSAPPAVTELDEVPGDHDYRDTEAPVAQDSPPRTEEAPSVPQSAEPDWPARFDELVEEHLKTFEGPKVGDPVVVTIVHSRRTLEGIAEEVKPDEIKIGIEQGSVTLYPEQVDDETRLSLFAQSYAEHHARIQAYHEYTAWRMARRPPPRIPPPRNPPPAVREPSVIPPPPVDEVGALDPPPPRFREAPEPPQNQDPDGRVPKVLAYILRNAAKPESLQVHSWYPVQKVGAGYQVRVRYQLDGADNFGTTREDMIFFMHADGTVYRRAAYKGR